MAKKKFKLMNLVLGTVGVLVSLAVGFGMTSKVLTIPVIPEILTMGAGWVIVTLTILSAIISIIKALK